MNPACSPGFSPPLPRWKFPAHPDRLKPALQTIPCLQHQTAGAVFAEFGLLFLLEHTERLAGEVRTGNVHRQDGFDANFGFGTDGFAVAWNGL